MEIKELPEPPDPEKAEKIRKNWLIYVLPVVFTFLGGWADNWLKTKEQKPCNDMVIMLLNELDSTRANEVKYLQQQLNGKSDEKGKK